MEGGIDTSRVEDRVSGKRETAFTGNEQVNVVMIILLCICDPLIFVEIHLSLENVSYSNISSVTFTHVYLVSGWMFGRQKYIETCIGGTCFHYKRANK